MERILISAMSSSGLMGLCSFSNDGGSSDAWQKDYFGVTDNATEHVSSSFKPSSSGSSPTRANGQSGRQGHTSQARKGSSSVQRKASVDPMDHVRYLIAQTDIETEMQEIGGAPEEHEDSNSDVLMPVEGASAPQVSPSSKNVKESEVQEENSDGDESEQYQTTEGAAADFRINDNSVGTYGTETISLDLLGRDSDE